MGWQSSGSCGTSHSSPPQLRPDGGATDGWPPANEKITRSGLEPSPSGVSPARSVTPKDPSWPSAPASEVGASSSTPKCVQDHLYWTGQFLKSRCCDLVTVRLNIGETVDARV